MKLIVKKSLIHCVQVTAEAVKILKVVEKCRPEVKFNFQDHLLGGVSINSKCAWPATLN